MRVALGVIVGLSLTIGTAAAGPSNKPTARRTDDASLLNPAAGKLPGGTELAAEEATPERAQAPTPKPPSASKQAGDRGTVKGPN
jgi:hypothetical protein